MNKWQYISGLRDKKFRHRRASTLSFPLNFTYSVLRAKNFKFRHSKIKVSCYKS